LWYLQFFDDEKKEECMPSKMPAFAISALVTLALPFTVLAQNATDSPAVVSGDGSAPVKQAPTPNTFGTDAISYIEVPANAFQPWNSSQTYTSANFGAGPRWVTSGGHDLVAPLHLPSGARVTYVELDYHDTSATGNTYGSLYVCSYSGTSCTQHPTAGWGPADCFQPGFICSGVAATDGDSSWGVDVTADNIVANNYIKSFTLLAEPGAFDGSEAVGGMIVGYVLQVSPAPLTASFTDVPPSHPYFQFIEALAASGITTGCGDGTNYCPTAPLTRGQMAVFLARALGLQWN
jgi:hypothetical protein